MRITLVRSMSLALAVTIAGMAIAAEQWRPVVVKDFVAAKKKSDELYAGIEQYEMKVRMSSYRSWDDALPYQSVDAYIWRSSDRFRSEVGGIVTLQDARIRVVFDAEEGRVLAADPVDLADAWALGAVDHVLNTVESCYARSSASGTEYKLVFARGAVYDHTVVKYDPRGWLVSSSTVWRQSVSEDPGQPMSPAFRPRLDVAYEVPRVKADGATKPDPWQFIRETPEGLLAIGQWKGAEVIDSRFRP